MMFSFEVVGSCTREILKESPPSKSNPVTTIIVTLGGHPPRKIPTSTSLLFQLLAPHISTVVRGQTPSTVAMSMPMIPHSASASLLALASTQALLDDDPLKEFLLAIRKFCVMTRNLIVK